MSVMNTVIRNTMPTMPKGIIYGPAGIGKTTFAGLAPESLIIDCENGAGNVPCQRTPFLDKWDGIRSWLTALANENHGYKIVAVDSLDWMIRRMEEHVNGHSLTQTLNKSHGGYGNGKNVLKNHIYQELLPMLNRIVERGIALILIAHARRIDITDLEGTTIERTAPEIQPDFLPTFIEWADFVCLARNSPDGRYLDTGSAADDRVLAKNRYGMPAKVRFEWGAFMDAVRGEAYREDALAGGDLAGEVQTLWRYLPGDKEAATLAWLGVTGTAQLAEAARAKLSQLRNRLLEAKAQQEATEEARAAEPEAEAGQDGTAADDRQPDGDEGPNTTTAEAQRDEEDRQWLA